jgi:site-specific recombinase XerD
MKYVRESRGVWIVDLPWPDGIRKRITMPNEKKANEISLRFQSAKVDGTWRELKKKLDMEERSQVMTFQEFGKLYLEEYVKSYNRAYKGKESRIRILGRKLNPIRVDCLQPQNVTQFVNSRKRKGINNRTINRDLIVLGHMLYWGVREHYLESNPLPEIQKLKEIQWVGERPTAEVIDSVFAELDSRVLPLFTFIRETGCRLEECLSVQHRQINLTCNPPVVTFSDNTKSGQARQVPMTDKAIEAVGAMPKASKYVFYHPESLTRWRNCRKLWDSAREKAGYSWLRIHDLRHAYAIKLAEEGCEMHFISEVLGHHSIDFTRDNYAKFSPRSAAKAVLKVLQGGKNGTNLAQAV